MKSSIYTTMQKLGAMLLFSMKKAMEICGGCDATGCDLNRLPEGCIAHVLSFTSPHDTCRSAAVSTAFFSAADSDAVWARFLPHDAHDIASRSASPLPFSSMKELYFSLCNSILLDQGKLSFWLDKLTGKKCYMISATELSIAWRDTPMYWRWITLPESRFSKVAELISVCWLDVTARFTTEMLSPDTTYAAYLVLRIRPQAFGLDLNPAELTIKMNNFLISTHMAQLQPRWTRGPQTRWHSNLLNDQIAYNASVGGADGSRAPQPRGDGWMEVELGEFYNDGRDGQEVEASLKEIKSGSWKRGLIVQGVEIRPKAKSGDGPKETGSSSGYSYFS